MNNCLELINKILLNNGISFNRELKIFDTHCHLSDLLYNEEEFLKIVNTISKLGIHLYVLNIGYDIKSSIRTLEQAKSFPKFIYPAIGIHPESSENLNDKSIAWLEGMINSNSSRVVAIGEIGLDYYRNPSLSSIKRQKKYFKKQILLAKRYNLPVLIHLRDNGDNSAFFDAIYILKKVHWNRGVVHCFSSNEYDIAKQFTELGFYISFSGIITFKNNEKISDLIHKIPIEKIVVETDSPYLSPEPFRGRKNFPWNVIFNLKVISDVKHIPLSEVVKKVFFNSFSLLWETNDKI
ncbi:MAG TPA: TatD family hydrolase [Mycoplasmatales bacterium]|jgi:TatD DNase family protein|nr:TatD family hydrolase [Mycoplasmatales bacterium]